MTATHAAPWHKATVARKEAIALLEADHKAVGHLFAEYEKSHSVRNKNALVAEICTALSAHAQMETALLKPESEDRAE
jgi:hypothetical protein